jgi:hypothetical protein
MEAVNPTAHPGELQAQSIGFQEGVGVTLGIQHPDLVVPGRKVSGRAVRQVALFGLAPAEQHRFTLLGQRLGLLSHDPGNHRLNQGIGPQKDFLSAALIGQPLIPGATGEQQQGTQWGGHQLRVMPRARVMKSS